MLHAHIVSAPRISIGMPVYDLANSLPAAVDSLLARTVQHFEIVIPDNGFTDVTCEICRAYAERPSRFRVFRQERP